MFRLITLFLLILVIVGCESRARYSAEFIAESSKLSSKVVSAVVYKNAETMEQNRGYALIRICPKKEQAGKQIKLHASVVNHDSDGNPIIELVHNEKTYQWSWSDASPLLEILNNSGYSNLNNSEIERLNHALFNSLSSPKGFVFVGQGREITVKDAQIERNARFDTGMQYDKWIEATSLRPCSVE